MAAVTDHDRHRRDNHFGDDHHQNQDGDGRDDPAGLDLSEEAAEYIAFQQMAALEQPICRRHKERAPYNGGRLAELFAWCFDGECIDGRELELHRENRNVELTEPRLHLPKQTDRGTHVVEYRQHRHRRRYNPETGYINWGESTGTALPEIDYDTFSVAFDTYLCERYAEQNLRVTQIEEYLEVADRFWHNPDLNSHQSLTKAIAHVRECEDA